MIKFEIKRHFGLFILICFICINHSLFADIPVNRTDFTITLTDGIVLDCSKFTPELKTPPGGFPAIIYCHGFGRTKEDEVFAASDEAQYGYYTYIYSMRGQGNSGGFSNLISTVEMNDFIQYIDYIKKEPNVNPNKIGAAGSSQGGIISFMAACNGAPLACVVSDLASPEFATSWIENGCIKMTLIWTLSYDNTIVRYSDEVSQFRGWALSDNPDDWNRLADALPRGRDFMDKVQDCKAPMLTSNTWEDKFFNTLGIINSREILKAPFRMYFGSMNGHGSALNPKEEKQHSGFVANWLSYWLRGQENMVLKANKYVYAVSVFNNGILDFTHLESPVWEPAGVNETKLFFTKSGSLAFQNNESNSSISFLNDYKGGMTLLQAVNYAFTGPDFDSHFSKSIVQFDSEPLEKETMMAGTPRADIYYSSNANICQYNFQIWEVMQDGSAYFVSGINYTDRNNTASQIRNKLMNGNSCGHLFKKGSKIRVIITNLDTRPDEKFLRTYPFVLPVLTRSENKIEIGQSYPSSIILPLK